MIDQRFVLLTPLFFGLMLLGFGLYTFRGSEHARLLMNRSQLLRFFSGGVMLAWMLSGIAAILLPLAIILWHVWQLGPVLLVAMVLLLIVSLGLMIWCPEFLQPTWVRQGRSPKA